MENRWAVAAGLGPVWLTPKVGGASTVKFGALDLSVRYRFRPPLEVALSFVAGGSAGDLATAGLVADFRYRFRAEHAWNAYVLGGLGVVSAGSNKATDTEKKGRGSIRLGGGGEYRFGRFAIFAELTLLGVAKNDKVEPPAAPPTAAYELERYGLSGGTLVAGGTFYF
jgi:hypothetical protein